jgi:hypothetical protein
MDRKDFYIFVLALLLLLAWFFRYSIAGNGSEYAVLDRWTKTYNCIYGSCSNPR